MQDVAQSQVVISDDLVRLVAMVRRMRWRHFWLEILNFHDIVDGGECDHRGCTLDVDLVGGEQ